jgi:hypothetical protein
MNRDRQIRVFISSTFRDMQAERDYLVKFTRPEEVALVWKLYLMGHRQDGHL